MANAEELKQMILAFRVSELHMLLGFAGRNKNGRKNELQARALELLQLPSPNIQIKVTKLYKSLQQQLLSVTPTHPPNIASAPAIEVSITAAQTAEKAPESMQPQPNRGYGNYPNRSAPLYLQNVYTYPPQTSKPASAQFPVHPDVKFKGLPFYDVFAELLKPSTLVPSGNQRQQESTFVFHLSPQQACAIGESRDTIPGSRMEYTTQVQLRFCLLETTCEQEDCFPPGIIVKVNGKVCPLPNPIPTNKPNVEPKRPSRPINITALVKLSPLVANNIQVQWSTDYTRGYVISVFLVAKMSSDDLLGRLKAKGIRAADYTRAMIKDKLKEDAEIATMSLRVSLMCPLGKMRMITPCRSSTCQHFQCFDASLYLQMNEKKPTWMCPVCDKPAVYDRLVIDGYFQEVLASPRLPADGNEIQVNMEGTWSPLVLTKGKEQSCVVEKTEAVTLEPELKKEAQVAPCKRETGKEDVDDSVVCLTDSDDETLPNVKWQEEPSTSNSNVVKESSNRNSSIPVMQPHSPGIIVLDGDSPPPPPSSPGFNNRYPVTAQYVDPQAPAYPRF